MATILVVDDDPDFCEITRTVLEREGYEVRTAANGEQALSCMRSHRPDLVILDVMMSSVLDGLDLSDRMQTDASLKKIPIIMVSSIASSQYAGMFPTDAYLPVDAWISKPVAPQTLLAQVRRYLPT
ncbi:MAG: response regulator [Anaerolineae bacterium]|nr:response regulator [Anaerolineae bacterium]